MTLLWSSPSQIVYISEVVLDTTEHVGNLIDPKSRNTTGIHKYKNSGLLTNAMHLTREHTVTGSYITTYNTPLHISLNSSCKVN